MPNLCVLFQVIQCDLHDGFVIDICRRANLRALALPVIADRPRNAQSVERTDEITAAGIVGTIAIQLLAAEGMR